MLDASHLQVLCHSRPTVRYVEYSVVIDRGNLPAHANGSQSAKVQAGTPESVATQEGGERPTGSPQNLSKTYRLYHTPPPDWNLKSGKKSGSSRDSKFVKLV